MITYVGNCEWRLIKSLPHFIANGIPGIRETWMGRTDKIALWQSQHPLYAAYQGGFITALDPNDDQGPFSTGEITVTLPPDFGRVIIKPDWSIKTATKSANVTAANVIPGTSNLSCTRTVSFYSPETRYSYFAQVKPDGARFGAAATVQQPVIIRSEIRVSGVGNGATQERVFAGGVAPAPIVSALTMSAIDRVVSAQAEQIPGTPWYSCEDVVSRELQGDST